MEATATAQHATVLRLEPREDFVLTHEIDDICKRANAYLDAGYACHFRGAAGTGKTTLALHVARMRERPVILMFGDEEFGTSDLVGSEKGLFSIKVIDNFIKSVVKTEEFRRPQWVDNRLTTACKHGYTLVYDEFSRSRPEANNVLLTILEEGILALPESQPGQSYMRVHPDFRAIFTSNPEEYAGVHKTQNALLDRMITLELDYYGYETEVAITAARSGIDREAAHKIVELVRRVREREVSACRATLRACLMIGRIARSRGIEVALRDPAFGDICVDVLCSGMVNGKADKWPAAAVSVRHILSQISAEDANEETRV